MKKQNYFITGASDGLGFCTTCILLNRGSHVTAAVRDIKAFENKLKERCSYSQEQLRIVECDLSNLNDLIRLLSEIDFSSIDVCIQAAGTSYFGTFDSLSDEQILSIVHVNSTSPILISSHFIRDAHPGSMLVNVTSITSVLPLPKNALYSAMKQGLRTLTVTNSFEQREKIKILDFCPGSIKTSFHKKASGSSKVPSSFAMTPDRCAEILVRSIDKKISGSQFPDLVAKIVYLATWNLGRLAMWVLFNLKRSH